MAVQRSYVVTVEYPDEDGDMMVDDALVQAETADEAQEVVLDNLDDFFPDIQEDFDEQDVSVLAVKER